VRSEADGYTLLLPFDNRHRARSGDREAPLRLAAGSGACLPRHDIRAGNDRFADPPGERPARIHRPPEEQSGKIQFCFVRYRHARSRGGGMVRQKAGVDIVPVPYRGPAAAMPDLLSGRIAMMIDGVPVQTQNIRNSSVRALAVTTATRAPSIPDVPTMREAG